MLRCAKPGYLKEAVKRMEGTLLILWMYQKLKYCMQFILIEVQCLHQDLEAKDHEIEKLKMAAEEASRQHQMSRPKPIKPIKPLDQVIETARLYAVSRITRVEQHQNPSYKCIK